MSLRIKIELAMTLILAIAVIVNTIYQRVTPNEQDSEPQSVAPLGGLLFPKWHSPGAFTPPVVAPPHS